MTHPRQKTAAFTLVEMSIVIVIIGIIVGSILGGRSYIRNAELNTVMNESKYYINQFNQFQSIYGAVAGDMVTANVVWPGAHNGDGNGLVFADITPAELYYVFEHLAYAGLIKGTYTGLGTGGVGNYDAKIGVNVPRGNVGNVTYLFDHPAATDGNVVSDIKVYYFDGIYSNVLRVAAQPDTAVNPPGAAFLTPKEAYQVDDKFDDGRPGSGWITTPKALSGGCITTAVVATSNYDTTTASNNGINCYFILNML